MKRVFWIAGLVAFLTSACATINVTAPPGSQVTIATKGMAGPTGCMLYGEKRVMYLLWGLVPLGDNSTHTIMPKSGKVVVQTEATPLDVALYLISNVVLPTTLYFKTAKVYKCSE